MTSYCREITEEYQLPMPKMNSKYFAYVSKSFDLALMAGAIASRIKPIPFGQCSFGKNDRAGICFFLIYAVLNASNDIITMKTFGI